eukprot:scaffold291295_cov35-Tisochrysis_lutea.AAC.3
MGDEGDGLLQALRHPKGGEPIEQVVLRSSKRGGGESRGVDGTARVAQHVTRAEARESVASSDA